MRGHALSSAVAERALARRHDVALVRAAGTRALAVALDLGAEEVGAWVDARGVDVEVLDEVAHGDLCVREFRRVVVLAGQALSLRRRRDVR